jgi:hypothetical protein
MYILTVMSSLYLYIPELAEIRNRGLRWLSTKVEDCSIYLSVFLHRSEMEFRI